MPRGDGTGPMGLGPMTGRAAGLCAGYPTPGYMNPVPGRGFWGRGGGGRGWRNWYYATGLPGWARAGYPYGVPPLQPMTGEREVEALRNQAQYMEDALDDIRKRIGELESAEKK